MSMANEMFLKYVNFVECVEEILEMSDSDEEYLIKGKCNKSKLQKIKELH